MSEKKLLSFEDFPTGTVLEFGSYPVTKEDIVAFAATFDPQPFHMDEEAGRRSVLGGLAASGWHTCSILMRMVCDGFLNATDGRGGPSIDEVKWLKPVRPGQTLSVRAEVLGARVSQSRPSIGFVQFRFDVFDQTGAMLMSQSNSIMMGRRGYDVEPVSSPRPADRTSPQLFEKPDLLPAWPELEIGKRIVLGTRTFPEADVIAFARLYDPQYFHTDPEASRKGPFGGLVASGWHTAASWMSAIVETKKRSDEATLARGEKVLEAGPSPGFVNLKWLRPVYAGDSVTFDTTAIEKRVTSRPGWGMVRAHNRGVNQHGVQVFEFESRVLWEIG